MCNNFGVNSFVNMIHSLKCHKINSVLNILIQKILQKLFISLQSIHLKCKRTTIGTHALVCFFPSHHSFYCVVQDDPELPHDSGVVPKLNGVVGGSVPSREIISMLDGTTSQVVKSASCIQTKNKKTKQKPWH